MNARQRVPFAQKNILIPKVLFFWGGSLFDPFIVIIFLGGFADKILNLEDLFSTMPNRGWV